jgi:hypothetical protein
VQGTTDGLHAIPVGLAEASGAVLQLLAGGPGLCACSVQALLHRRRALGQGLADAFGGLVDTWIFVVPSATESVLPARARRITVAVNRRALVRVAFIVVTPL